MIVEFFAGEYEFLSNFYSHPVTYEDIEYPTNEHAFQAAKTLNVGQRWNIAQAPTASKAKYLGRSVELRPDWDTKVRYDVMLRLLGIKFSGDLGKRLRDTGDSVLVEGNTWHDNTWGVCYCGDCPDGRVVGHNMLGWMLMQLRTKLLREAIKF